jgi:hypothetical protein
LVQLKSPDFSSQQNINIEHIYYTTIFNGKIFDPYGKPSSPIQLNFFTLPYTTNDTITSDKNGLWTFADNKIVPDNEFKVVVTYDTALKQRIVV